MHQKTRYGRPAVLSTLQVRLGRGICAGSDVMLDSDLESAGIPTEDFNFSEETDMFNFTWEETL